MRAKHFEPRSLLRAAQAEAYATESGSDKDENADENGVLRESALDNPMKN
jgi:hypothetical protein